MTLILRGDRNQCPACRKAFNSTAAFDKHRAGYFETPSKDVTFPRRCLDETEMRAKGMDQNAAGFWVGSRREWAA